MANGLAPGQAADPATIYRPVRSIGVESRRRGQKAHGPEEEEKAGAY